MLRYHGDATKACKVAISTCIIATKSKTRIFEWKKKKKKVEKRRKGGRGGEEKERYTRKNGGKLKWDREDRFFAFFCGRKWTRARGKSAAQFLHGLLRFKVDLRAATASFGFDHPRPKKVNDQWSRGIGQTHLRFPSCETYETRYARNRFSNFCYIPLVIAFSTVYAPPDEMHRSTDREGRRRRKREEGKKRLHGARTVDALIRPLVHRWKKYEKK